MKTAMLAQPGFLFLVVKIVLYTNFKITASVFLFFPEMSDI